MYGMIHRAARQMVLESRGPELWAAIELQAEIGHSELIGSQCYDDETTLRILVSAASCLESDFDGLLHELGRYWWKFVDRGALGAIINFTGEDPVTLITNLGRMHRSIGDVMPGAQMPSFVVIGNQPGRLQVRYESSRRGLAPFVEGLFVGLFDRFGMMGTVRMLENGGNAADFELLFEHEGVN